MVAEVVFTQRGYAIVSLRYCFLPPGGVGASSADLSRLAIYARNTACAMI